MRVFQAGSNRAILHGKKKFGNRHFVTSNIGPGWKEDDVYFFHWNSIYVGSYFVFKCPLYEGVTDSDIEASSNRAEDESRWYYTLYLARIDKSPATSSAHPGLALMTEQDCKYIESTPSGVSYSDIADILQGKNSDIKTMLAAEGQSLRMIGMAEDVETHITAVRVWCRVVERIVPLSDMRRVKGALLRYRTSVKKLERVKEGTAFDESDGEAEGRRVWRRLKRAEEVVTYDARVLNEVVHMLRRKCLWKKCFTVQVRGYSDVSDNGEAKGFQGGVVPGATRPMPAREYGGGNTKRVRARVYEGEFNICSGECSCNESCGSSEAESDGVSEAETDAGFDDDEMEMERPEAPHGASNVV